MPNEFFASCADNLMYSMKVQQPKSPQRISNDTRTTLDLRIHAHGTTLPRVHTEEVGVVSCRYTNSTYNSTRLSDDEALFLPSAGDV